MRSRKVRNISIIMALVLLIGAMTACNTKAQDPKATITLEDGASIVIILYPEKAPNTVNNFISLALSGFYDGTTFHRIVDRFIIQGGDPNGDGTGGPGYTIDGEFSANGFKKNDLKHEKYVISMARFGSEEDYNTAGSQFFIMLADKDYLDGKYAAFGKVFTGMDVVDEIARLATKADGETPREPPVIQSITINTYGVTYSEPKVNKIAE